jgi:glycerol-3-phosphate dehydrogenase
MGFVDDVRDEEWDVVVIGGGINGAGVARDAAMRGLDVLLLEKGDFASGTSSRSTKLIHGGLRYLEHYEFGLVFESLRERAIQHRVASHLVQPAQFMFPVYESGSMPSWKLRFGLTVYDLLSLFRGFGRHRFVDADDVRRVFPQLRSEGLSSAGIYYDCQMDDARLVLENVLDADRRGATVRNYCEVVSVDPVTSRSLWEVTLEDRRSGERLSVRTDSIVNATGPWSDAVAREWREGSSTYLRPTKGAHLILPAMETSVAGFVPSVEDDRLIFIIPWQGRTLVGTTDTEFHDDPDDVAVTSDDRDYLLRNVNHYLSGKQFDREDVLAEFAGLRPLYDPSGGTGPPGAVSRDHEVIEERDSIYSIVGGKYTTYRAIASDTLGRMGAPGRSRTHRKHLPGGWKNEGQRDTYADALRMTGELDSEQCERFLDRYGRRVIKLTEVVGEIEGCFERPETGTPVLNAEIDYATLGEYALDVDDVVRRRTQLFTRGTLSDETRETIRDRMKYARNWAGIV